MAADAVSETWGFGEEGRQIVANAVKPRQRGGWSGIESSA